MVRNSVLNFKHKPLNGMHDFPCSTFKVFYVQEWGPCGMGVNTGLSPGKLSTCHPSPCMSSMPHVTWSKVKYNFAHGTLGHAIEHGKVKGSHMTFNVQHESSFYLY